MKTIVRDQIQEMLSTLWEGVNFARSQATTLQDSYQMLCDCYAVLQSVDSSLQSGLSEKRYAVYQVLTEKLFVLLEQLNGQIQTRENTEKEAERIEALLHTAKEELIAEEEIEYDIVFLPYKAAMWDSLESIWRAAEEDPRCHAYVIPIPYYDRNPDFSFGKLHYEGDLFPEYVPITHYTKYNLLEKKPDVIYIHNPYDDYNRATSVHPAFYSDKLKNYTKKLVYVPYFIPGSYASVESARDFCRAKGITNADLVVAQSDVHKYLLVANGKPADQVAVLGNPKFDYVLNHLEDTEIPEEWKEKIGDKEAVLVCLGVSNYLKWSERGCVDVYDWLIDLLIHKYHKVVLYRPHPLLESTIQTMRSMERYVEYRNFLNKYLDTDNFILDTFPDALPAIKVTKCMLSDYSSLCFSYMITGKPVGIMTFGHDEESFEKFYFALDYRTCYMIDIAFRLAWNFNRNNPDAFNAVLPNVLKKFPIKLGTLEEEERQIYQYIDDTYIAKVVNETETKRNERDEKRIKQLENMSEKCGERIHSYILT